VATTSAQSARTVQLPEVLDLNAVEALVTEFLSHRGNELAVDASQVQRMTGQGLQVLLSAGRTWREDGQTIRIVEPSEAFTERSELFGLAGSDWLAGEAA
jgi:chemotaxis protein CheX